MNRSLFSPTVRGRAGGFWCILLIVMALGLVLAGRSLAHPILQNPIWIEVGPEVMKVKIYVSMRELNVVQGLPIAMDGSVDMTEAKDTAPRHKGYLLDHLNFRADGNPLSGKVMQIEPPTEVGKGIEGPDRAHFVYRLEYPLERPPGRVTFSHTMVVEFPSAPGVPWDLSYTYRFGPPGVPPVEYGAVPRDSEVGYNTGYAPLPGSVAQPAPVVSQTVPLLRLAVLGAAFGLGVAGRGVLGRLLLVLTVCFWAGWGAGSGFGIKMPLFLSSALGGIGILLVAVDNIHRPLERMGLRRWLLAIFFPAAAGLAAGLILKEGVAPALRGWLGLAGGFLIGAVPALLAAGKVAHSPGPDSAPGAPGFQSSEKIGEKSDDLTESASGGREVTSAAPSTDAAGGVSGKSKHPWLQALSLILCVAGLALLFDSLGLRPWEYWLQRLRG